MSLDWTELVKAAGETLALGIVAAVLFVLAQVRRRVTSALSAAREAYAAAERGREAAATAAHASMAAHDTATQAVEQVRNSHTTNLRDDIDALAAEIARVHTRLDAISELAVDAHRAAHARPRPFWRR